MDTGVPIRCLSSREAFEVVSRRGPTRRETDASWLAARVWGNSAAHHSRRDVEDCLCNSRITHITHTEPSTRWTPPRLAHATASTSVPLHGPGTSRQYIQACPSPQNSCQSAVAFCVHGCCEARTTQHPRQRTPVLQKRQGRGDGSCTTQTHPSSSTKTGLSGLRWGRKSFGVLGPSSSQ